MQRLVTISAIALCYFIFAILLNSVGTVILQSIGTFEVTKPEASVLEGFKDLSIAFVSFFVASLIPRIGYKIALLIGLVLVLAACIATPLIAQFWMIKLLFAAIGVSFALVKVSVYSIVGQLSNSTQAHSSLLNTVEGIFMLGSLAGYWLFSLYIDPDDYASMEWMNTYWVLAAMLVVIIPVVAFSPIKKSSETYSSNFLTDFTDMLKMTYQPLVLVFVISVFMYVLIEQGLGSWLPTFNKEVLKLPIDVSVQITSIFAACIAIGRLLAGQVLRYMAWYPFLNICLIGMAGLMIASLPLASTVHASQSISDAPLVAFLLPLIGLLMAPLYPVLNSVMLSSLPVNRHASMTGLIVIFSALGGTTGSILTGFLFESFGGQQAFYLLLVPIAGIAAAIYLFNIKNNQQQQAAEAV